MPDPSNDRLRLTPPQQRLFEALVDRRAAFGEWYRAAIVVLNDTEMPDRLALAAHAVRELMEKLPGDTTFDRARSLPEKVRDLETAWTGAHEENVRGSGVWDGEISEALSTFLVAMQTFFDEQAALTKTRLEYAKEFLDSLDSTAGLPGDIQHANAKQWRSFHKYFADVSHHAGTRDSEFEAQFAGFESFIAARLKPRPTDDFAAIDALLEED